MFKIVFKTIIFFYLFYLNKNMIYKKKGNLLITVKKSFLKKKKI